MAPCRTMTILLCLVLFLAASSPFAAATRIGATTEMKINRKSLGFNYNHILGYLPKGVSIPPSAPSKRHNSLVDSLPH
ncbi:Protein IDA [Cardamine amara subsp. amara]|uniref:Protein IDA n=1 Tax=Cardamine amara subsp. amara TaxID=228776 RepID=A0ABD1BN06_CARAN